MRQRTRRPSRRVSDSRIPAAASHSDAAEAAARRRWRVRTAAEGSHSSSVAVIPLSCPVGGTDPAQAGGLLVLPVPLAGLRPLGQPAVLDAGDAGKGAGAGAPRRP